MTWVQTLFHFSPFSTRPLNFLRRLQRPGKLNFKQISSERNEVLTWFLATFIYSVYRVSRLHGRCNFPRLYLSKLYLIHPLVADEATSTRFITTFFIFFLHSSVVDFVFIASSYVWKSRHVMRKFDLIVMELSTPQAYKSYSRKVTVKKISRLRIF